MSLSIEEYAKFAEAAYSNDLTKNQELNGWIVLVCRLGFNPTKNREYKTKLKTAA